MGEGGCREDGCRVFEIGRRNGFAFASRGVLLVVLFFQNGLFLLFLSFLASFSWLCSCLFFVLSSRRRLFPFFSYFLLSVLVFDNVVGLFPYFYLFSPNCSVYVSNFMALVIFQFYISCYFQMSFNTRILSQILLRITYDFVPLPPCRAFAITISF